MNQDESIDEERLALFALVWAKPTSEVAKELGISDVAVAKRCRRLQVPKPPRGYWAKIASGHSPKRPPLPAYQAELAKRFHSLTRSVRQVRLSKLQAHFLQIALEELKTAGQDISGCDLARDGIRTVSPVLAAQALIVIQNRYEKWIADRTTLAKYNAALSSLRNLVDKLQPHAKEQVLVFRQRSDRSHSGIRGHSLTIRATSDLLERLARLSRLSKDEGLAYVVADVSGLMHAWSVAAIASPTTHSDIKTSLCVSASEVWVKAILKGHWATEQFETDRLRLRDICPLDLLPEADTRLPSRLRPSTIRPYAERLQALQEAQTIFETLSIATYDMTSAIPNERLALFDRLWSRAEEPSPLLSSRTALRRLDKELDRWERELDAETLQLCEDVLGIRIGDIVFLESRGKPLRLEVQGMTLFSSDSESTFSVWGQRFRKDGLLGKRVEHVSITVGSS